MNVNKTVYLLGILWLGIAGLAAAEVVSDDAMRVAIETKFDRKDITNGGGPRVDVKDGVATLTGNVKSLWKKNEAIELALEVEGVDSVMDELEIAFAENDKEVGEAVAKVVRRYPHFTIYDDVNISVDNGKVRLTGRVTMPFKSDELESRVSKVTGVQSLTNEIETLPVNIDDERIRANLTTASTATSVPAVRVSRQPTDPHHRRTRQRRSHRSGQHRSRKAQSRDHRALDVRSVPSRQSPDGW